MEGVETWMGLIAGILAIAAVIVSLTRHLTQVQAKAERAKIERENASLQERVEEAEARCSQLSDQIQIAGEAGQAAMAQKAAIDAELRRLMQVFGASGGSVYVPVRGTRGDVRGLAFLSIEPYSIETQQLRSKLIPLKSLAGRSFEASDSFIVSNVSQHADHFKAAEQISSYAPAMTLSHALLAEGEPVGVLQLLSREGEQGFAEEDLQRVAAAATDLASNLAVLTKSGDYLKWLGISADDDATHGSVIYFDLSSSSLLFQELSSSFALQLLNEYFEAMCEAAFNAGATLDNYTGDGALLRFNVPRRQPQHELAAISAALEMQREFSSIREYWTAISPQFGELQHRAGIATGPLLPASLGHSQVQSLTVIGYPIAIAAALCELAPRDRSVLFASAETIKAAGNRVICDPIGLPENSKVRRFTTSAFEVTAIR